MEVSSIILTLNSFAVWCVPRIIIYVLLHCTATSHGVLPWVCSSVSHRIVAYSIISYRVMTHDTISYDIVSHYILSHHIILHRIIPHHTISHFSIFHHIVSLATTPQYTTSHDTALHQTTLSEQSIVNDIILYYTTLHPQTRSSWRSECRLGCSEPLQRRRSTKCC